MEIGHQILFAIEINGEFQDAVATGKQDNRSRPFFQVSIHNGPVMELYDLTRLSGKEYVWYDRKTRRRSEMAHRAGASILEYVVDYNK